ncbi:MAG: 50S ribosomal protein L34e [Candidatus Aenigmarchaeota archaeon]|nr:50S ribosomal protein L34e [Candidatus Aenigmarchaeota archaeon]
MPTPAQRSTSFRKNSVTTPGGKVNIHYTKKDTSHARCGNCRKPLHGVPTGTIAEIAKLGKTQKRPDRPFGGNLCSACTRAKMKLKNMERWDND